MKVLNCTQFKEMIVSGANNLENNHEVINTLNVFPVPDGDTGTNMMMTFSSGVSEANKVLNDHVGETAKVLAKGMLMGARGNSGVILSQIFKGINKSVTGKEEITTEDFAKAYAAGSTAAYKAVMKPVEGTILTVVRESGDAALAFMEANPDASMEELVDEIVLNAKVSLEHTPELLPVLKEVGVVDSGGAGLVAILEGFAAYLHGQPITIASGDDSQEEENKFTGYCVEVEFNLEGQYKKIFDPKKLQQSLSKTCTAVKLLRKDNIVRLHVHTLNPGEILSTVIKFGEMNTVKVENMSISHQHTFEFEEEIPKEKYAIITVCNGDGIKEVFEQLGVKHFINGGQTMNPATEDFVALITTKINADNIIILPNNGNIVLAANQAKEVLGDRNIRVVETKSIPQGISSCLAFDSESDMDSNVEAMSEALTAVKTGEVTNAIKDTSYNGVAINAGDYIGICGNDILADASDLLVATKTLLENMIDEDSSFITLIYGNQTNEEVANEVSNYVKDELELDCEVVNGKQDLYPFIIGVE